LKTLIIMLSALLEDFDMYVLYRDGNKEPGRGGFELEVIRVQEKCIQHILSIRASRPQQLPMSLMVNFLEQGR